MAEELVDQYLLIYIYDESGAPIGMYYQSVESDEFEVYWFEKNLFGDVVGVYDANLTKILSYEYTAYGLCYTTTHVSGTNASLNPFRYRGYYYDSDLGLYYLNNRYYDARNARFINLDGYINGNGDILGYNMFAYCSNNPVMFVDPFGEFIFIISPFWKIEIKSIDTEKGKVNSEEPPPPESGYRPPKKDPNPKKKQSPSGEWGWPDNKGAIWIPNNTQHGGAGWVREFPDGSHEHRYPSGHIRSHKSSKSNDFWSGLGKVFKTVGAGIGIIAIIADDITGFGAANDAALPALIGIFVKGIS